MGRVPTAEDKARFWALIEAAWAELGSGPAELRRMLLTRDPAGDEENERLYEIDAFLDGFLERLAAVSADLSPFELVAMDRVLERALHDADREDIHEKTDGSDDGFLYARGHIVAMGREFHEAVLRDPRFAVLDGECEAMCYFFNGLYRERTGEEWAETGSGISRESCSNAEGWPSLQRHRV